MKTKCHAIGIELEIGKPENFNWDNAKEYCGMLVQNPDNLGSAKDYTSLSAELKKSNIIFTIVADILSLTIFKPPGEMGADIACGSA